MAMVAEPNCPSVTPGYECTRAFPVPEADGPGNVLVGSDLFGIGPKRVVSVERL